MIFAQILHKLENTLPSYCQNKMFKFCLLSSILEV